MPTSQRHHNKGGIGHLIAFCTVCAVAKFVVEVCASVNSVYAK